MAAVLAVLGFLGVIVLCALLEALADRHTTPPRFLRDANGNPITRPKGPPGGCGEDIEIIVRRRGARGEVR